MKKKWIIPAAIAVLVAAVFGIYQMQASAGEPEMTIDQARQQAEKQYNATVTEIELDRSGSEPRYDIDLENNETQYDLTLNGNTGEVISLKESSTQKTLPGKDPKDQSQASADDQQQSDNQKTAPSQKQASQAEVKITMDEAVNIATDEVGGTVTNAEFDEEDGLPVYELELETADDEAEVVINAQSGEIVTITYDKEDD
ncbi:Peptidase propeptide and YPEB domain-containing protein [Terribacillus halophilus]|uniref:Peptidase propeptide and YPEB domain-containing protein n=1 Tax=Terribacillus halophilus TaxID=361279 RepID=A0A1G6MT54_9BACI|nr:PepSY domain-containing protein [Terribacillus halophilus]SDC58758.1 Peptidase propeptide and YPEB domain-containing protein [Terribacillus halophilus]